MGTRAEQVGEVDGNRSTAMFENSVELNRSTVEVFDYCSDLRNEFEWNPSMRSVELITPEPVQVGSRYRARWKGGPTSIIEYVEFDRPGHWVASSESRIWRIHFEGRVQEIEEGCSLAVFRLEIEARGIGRLFLPVLRRVMQRQEKAGMARIKRALEA